MNPLFITQKTVDFHETDMAGIMHFSNFFKWMEIAEHHFFRSLNIPLILKEASVLKGWPRVRARCEYHAPIYFEDCVEIILFIEEILSRAIRYQFKFYKLKDNEPKEHIATGGLTTLFTSFDIADKSMKPCSIPKSILYKLYDELKKIASPLAAEVIAQPTNARTQ